MAKRMRTEVIKNVQPYRKSTGSDVFHGKPGSFSSYSPKPWTEEQKQLPVREKRGLIVNSPEVTPSFGKRRLISSTPELTPSVGKYQDKKKFILASLNALMTELDTLGIPSVLYLLDNDTPFVLSSGEKGAGFVSSFPNVEEDFVAYCQQEQEPVDPNDDRKLLRREVQQLFNERYAEALGVESASVPYMKLELRGITVEGLPPGTQLMKPSYYGVRKMRQILDAKDRIRFHVRNPPNKDELNEQKAENVIGSKIKYLWTVETSKGISTEWFSGRITGYDSKRKMYSVLYDGSDSVDYVSADTMANTNIFRFVD